MASVELTADTPAKRYRHILYECRDGIAHIVLNNPERLNTLGLGPGSSRDEIAQALKEADANPSIGCILITGAGGSFCGGADLTAVATDETPLDVQRFGEEILAFYAVLRALHKPIVAGVHGLCIGAALGLIAHCDLVIAADDARFGLIEGRMGYPGAAEIVPLVGPAWAKFLIFTGELIDARRAEMIGLVLTVVPKDNLASKCTSLAERIARLPREAVSLNKLSIDNVFEAMGRSVARIVGRAHENLTKSMSRYARAPDGRRFEEILRAEGVDGIKRAREQQFKGAWLPPAGKGEL